MMNLVSLEERARRLKNFLPPRSIAQDYSLLKVAGIQVGAFANVRHAVLHYLWVSLREAFPQKTFPFSIDLLQNYAAELQTLPNLTPNGLVLPKQENILAFNELHAAVSGAFSELGIADHVERVQFPINVRLQRGALNPEIDRRPRASVKAHSDIWAGDPSAGMLIFLNVLGDPAKPGIRFLQPKEFPSSFIRTLPDYDDGSEIANSAEEFCRFSSAGWYFVDPFVIHQTTKTGEGLRLSIDFRCIPREKVSSDQDEDDLRKPYFIPFSAWHDIGRETLLLTKDKMADFAKSNSRESFTMGYPVRLRRLSIESGEMCQP